jgi:hypothetical protein
MSFSFLYQKNSKSANSANEHFDFVDTSKEIYCLLKKYFDEKTISVHSRVKKRNSYVAGENLPIYLRLTIDGANRIFNATRDCAANGRLRWNHLAAG